MPPQTRLNIETFRTKVSFHCHKLYPRTSFFPSDQRAAIWQRQERLSLSLPYQRYRWCSGDRRSRQFARQDRQPIRWPLKRQPTKAEPAACSGTQERLTANINGLRRGNFNKLVENETWTWAFGEPCATGCHIFCSTKRKQRYEKRLLLGFYYRFYNRVRTPARPPQSVSSYTFGQGRVLDFFFISIYMNGKSFIACSKRFWQLPVYLLFHYARLNGWRQNSRAGHRQHQ